MRSEANPSPAPDPAWEEALRKHTPLVEKIATKVGVPRNDPYRDDVVQEGCILLRKIARNFDPGRGNKFETYAGRSLYRDMTQVAGRLKRGHNFVPRTTMVNRPGPLVDQAMESRREDVPLDEMAGRLAEGLGAEAAEDADRVNEALTSLPPLEFRYLYRRFYAGDDPEAVAADLGIPAAWAPRFEAGALARMRKILGGA